MISDWRLIGLHPARELLSLLILLAFRSSSRLRRLPQVSTPILTSVKVVGVAIARAVSCLFSSSRSFYVFHPFACTGFIVCVYKFRLRLALGPRLEIR